MPNVRDMQQQISPNFACETSAPLSSLKFGGLDCRGPNDSISGTKSGMGRERIKEGRRRENKVREEWWRLETGEGEGRGGYVLG